MRKSLTINRLAGAGRPKRLIINDLGDFLHQAVNIYKVLLVLLGELGSYTLGFTATLDLVDVLPEGKDLEELGEVRILFYCYHISICIDRLSQQRNALRKPLRDSSSCLAYAWQ